MRQLFLWADGESFGEMPVALYRKKKQANLQPRQDASQAHFVHLSGMSAIGAVDEAKFVEVGLLVLNTVSISIFFSTSTSAFSPYAFFLILSCFSCS